MKKFYIVVLALAVACAFGAAASSASALESMWLVGNELAPATNATLTGELQIDVLNEAGTSLLFEVKCSGVFNGVVGPDAEDSISSATDLLGNAITELAGAKGISCEVVSSSFLACDNSTKLAELWPVNLPWPSLVILTGTEYEDTIGGTAGKEPAFEFLCTDSFGGTEEGLCEGPLKAMLTNGPSEVLGEFLEVDNTQECSSPLGKLHAMISGKGSIAVAGKTLAVSEA